MSPQINLLGQDAQHAAPWTKGTLYVVRFFVLLFIVVVAYWAYIFVRARLVTQDIAQAQEQIIQTQKEILANQNRRELLVRQGQLKTADALIADYQYWSKLLPELARVTLRGASYISFSADRTGTARLSVTVPSYEAFDQFLQVFDLPPFDEPFSQITVSSVGKYQQGDTQSVRFDVTLKYNQNFLKAQTAPQ